MKLEYWVHNNEIRHTLHFCPSRGLISGLYILLNWHTYLSLCLGVLYIDWGQGQPSGTGNFTAQWRPVNYSLFSLSVWRNTSATGDKHGHLCWVARYLSKLSACNWPLPTWSSLLQLQAQLVLIWSLARISGINLTQ